MNIVKQFPATIIVRFQRVGFHNWPGAPGHRSYLGKRHRHLFKFQVEMTVAHDDREVEFHDMRDDMAQHVPDGYEFGAKSCEMIARDLIDHITKKYGPGRSGAVEVWEDGEVGARVTYET